MEERGMKMKTNVKTKTAIKEMSGLLNNCSMLLQLDVDRHADRHTLSIATDQGTGSFSVTTKEKMISFLSELQKSCYHNHEDIGELIEELE
jgi:hypothetical protein